MIDEVDRRLIQLEMEKLSLRKEKTRDGINRIEQIDKEMEALQEKQVCLPHILLSILESMVHSQFQQCMDSACCLTSSKSFMNVNITQVQY